MLISTSFQLSKTWVKSYGHELLNSWLIKHENMWKVSFNTFIESNITNNNNNLCLSRCVFRFNPIKKITNCRIERGIHKLNEKTTRMSVRNNKCWKNHRQYKTNTTTARTYGKVYSFRSDQIWSCHRHFDLSNRLSVNQNKYHHFTKRL